MQALKLFILAVTVGGFIGFTHVPAAHAMSDSQLKDGASGFVQGLSDDAIKAIQLIERDRAKAKARFRDILERAFDINTIGRFVLGRYWRVADASQQSAYLDLFRDLIVVTYTNRFSSYSGEVLEIRRVHLDDKKDAMVFSQIVRDSGPPIDVDWRVRHRSGKYRIIDVMVEDVSMSLNQRNDFSAIIQRNRGSIDALLDEMRKQIRSF